MLPIHSHPFLPFPVYPGNSLPDLHVYKLCYFKDHTVCKFLILALFTQYNVLKIHPSHCMYQSFVPFYCWEFLAWTYQFNYSSTKGHLSCFLFLAVTNKTTTNIHTGFCVNKKFFLCKINAQVYLAVCGNYIVTFFFFGGRLALSWLLPVLLFLLRKTGPELTFLPIFLYFICGTSATAWLAQRCHVCPWDPNRRTPGRPSRTCAFTCCATRPVLGKII